MMGWQIAMFEQAMGRRSPSTSPPADRRRQLELEDRRELLNLGQPWNHSTQNIGKGKIARRRRTIAKKIN
jgi:hypothetical protein